MTANILRGRYEKFFQTNFLDVFLHVDSESVLVFAFGGPQGASYDRFSDFDLRKLTFKLYFPPSSRPAQSSFPKEGRIVILPKRGGSFEPGLSPIGRLLISGFWENIFSKNFFRQYVESRFFHRKISQKWPQMGLSCSEFFTDHFYEVHFGHSGPTYA